MKQGIILVLGLLLAACASKPQARPEPIIITQPVPVATPAPCVPDTLGAPPDYVDSDKALKGASGPAERYQLLWAGRAQRKARLNEIEPIVAACPRGSTKKK